MIDSALPSKMFPDIGWLASLLTLVTAVPPTAETIDPPAAPRAFAPRLTSTGDGLILSWLEPVAVTPESSGPTHRLRWSRRTSGGWTPPGTIVQRDDMFANWADVPGIASRPPGELVAYWLRRSGPAAFAYDVVLSRSRDGGRTWESIGTPHRDQTPTEHGFVSVVEQDGRLRLIWLDGRAMDPAATTGGDPGAMTLRTAVLDDEGVGPAVVLDERVCECCNTSAAMTSSGPLVVYRDRSPQEVRDIAVVRLVDGRWSAPAAVHDDGWAIAACPVNGPSVAARGERVVVAWYTGAVPYGAVRVAFSSDAGATFAPAVTIDDRLPIGRVEVVMDPSGEAVACWIAQDATRAAVVVRRIAPDGRLGGVVEIAGTTRERAAGFPRMTLEDEMLVVAWTDPSGAPGVRAIRLALGDIPPPGANGLAPPPIGLEPGGVP